MPANPGKHLPSAVHPACIPQGRRRRARACAGRDSRPGSPPGLKFRHAPWQPRMRLDKPVHGGDSGFPTARPRGLAPCWRAAASRRSPPQPLEIARPRPASAWAHASESAMRCVCQPECDRASNCLSQPAAPPRPCCAGWETAGHHGTPSRIRPLTGPCGTGSRQQGQQRRGGSLGERSGPARRARAAPCPGRAGPGYYRGPGRSRNGTTHGPACPLLPAAGRRRRRRDRASARPAAAPASPPPLPGSAGQVFRIGRAAVDGPGEALTPRPAAADGPTRRGARHTRAPSFRARRAGPGRR
jgi:hypothetical protein